MIPFPFRRKRPPVLTDPDTRARVVIVGGGFGGLQAAKALADAPVQVTLVDRRNHHLFQPLLYQVATAALSPADIAQPIRSVLRGQPNVEVILAEVDAIDVAAKEVVLDEDAGRLPYDYLILAAGANHAYFGHDEWASDAPGLKTLEDALDIRRRILTSFEEAEREPDPGPAQSTDDLRRRRRRTDRRRNGGRDRRDRPLLAGAGFPPHRHPRREGDPDRGWHPAPRRVSRPAFPACAAGPGATRGRGPFRPAGDGHRPGRGDCRRRDHPREHDRLGRGSAGFATRSLARCGARPRGAGARQPGPLHPWPSRDLRHRRHGFAQGRAGPAAAGCGAGGNAAGSMGGGEYPARDRGEAGTRRSATATSATWRPSVAIRRWPTFAVCA